MLVGATAWHMLEVTGVSDGDGRFGLAGLPEGHVTLTASHPDYETAVRDTDPAATGDVVISLSTGGEISGVVVSSDDASPVPGAAVMLDLLDRLLQ